MTPPGGIKYLLFDLDGTLTDSKQGIVRSLEYALSHFNVQIDSDFNWNTVIGPPLYTVLQSHFELSGQDLEQAIALYRERYADIGKFENQPYPGVARALKSLMQQGKHLAVVSSKAEIFAHDILEKFELTCYFEQVVGSPPDYRLMEKDELISVCIDRFKNPDLQKYMMVGDRKFDILGAKKVGVCATGVLYGYGSEQELRDAGADFLVKHLSEVEALTIE